MSVRPAPCLPGDTGADTESDFRMLAWLVVCVAAVFALWGAYQRDTGDPAYSRLATVYSLVHHGTWYIDRPLDQPPIRFEQQSIDKVMVKGHILSSKPPVLPLLMTGEYWLLHKTLGWTLDNEAHTDRIVRLMTVTLVGGSYVLTLVLTARILAWMALRPLTRVVTLAAVAFATQLWGFSTLINNHVPGAAMTMAALYLAFGLALGKRAPSWWRFALFGLTAGLVPTIDMPAAVLPFAAALFLLARFPQPLLTWGVAGAALPLAVHAGVLLAVTGSPLPVQFHKDLYLYEASYWRHPLGVDALNEPKGTYLFHMTLGRHGLFSLYPFLLGGVAATIRALLSPRFPWRRTVLAGAAAVCVMLIYYTIATNNYGGESFGFRWMIAAMPVLALMAAPLVDECRRTWRWLFLGLVLGISFYSAWQSTNTGWASGREWICRFLGTSY